MFYLRGESVVTCQVDVESPAAFGVFALGEELRNEFCIEVAAVESHVRCCQVADVYSGGLHGGFAAVERFDLLEARGEAC